MQGTELTGTAGRALSIQRSVRGEIPFLRRFGRSLTGEQNLADLCVIQLMEELLTEPDCIVASDNAKVALYRRLLQNLETVAQFNGESLSSALPTPRSRQAHLLTMVEGFSCSQAAEVLGVTIPEMDALLQEARNELTCQTGARILIIEDEEFIVMHIESLVHQLGHHVVGTAETMDVAVAQARKTRPDLILSDVNLADGSSGHDAVQEILKEQEIPVIFITAYPERLLTGNCAEPAFLITKPFRDEAVKATITQAHFLSQRKLGSTARGLEIALP